MRGEGPYEVTVVCCGKKMPANPELIQAEMVSNHQNAYQQALEWRRLAGQYTDPEWMRLCVGNAEAMVELWHRVCALDEALGQGDNFATAHNGRRKPVSSLAECHFEWLGDRGGRESGVQASVVRGGIAELAERGFLSRDQEQQDAMRRGLGLALNASERSSRAPWVRWMGDGAVLNYLVDSLWEMHLIHCSGGQHMKWQTLCGIFLRRDGTCFETSIKSNRCCNEYKRQQIDTAFLNSLRCISR